MWVKKEATSEIHLNWNNNNSDVNFIFQYIKYG